MLGLTVSLQAAVAVAVFLATLGIVAGGAAENSTAYATPPRSFPEPYLANNVAIAEISNGMYAVVTNLDGNGVHIINITDPAYPVPAATITSDAGMFTELDRLADVLVAEISGGTYAAVTSVRGVHIINITDPAYPVPAATITVEANEFGHVGGVIGIDIAEISGGTYAAITVAGVGVQIINITDPSSPDLVMGPTSGASVLAKLGLPTTITIAKISGGTYAAVTSLFGDVHIANITDPAAPSLIATISDDSRFREMYSTVGRAIAEISGGIYVAIVDSHGYGALIFNITDPAVPVPVATISDDTGIFDELGDVDSAAIAEISGGTYAAITVAGVGVQIINITDPSSPTPLVGISDGANGFTELDGAFDIDFIDTSGGTYAAAVGLYDDGVQIINITDPSSPTPLVGISDGANGFTELDGAFDIDIIDTSGRIYAAVANGEGGDVQIINLTDPASPTPVIGLADKFGELGRVRGIELAEISGGIYAVVASAEGNGVHAINITSLHCQPPGCPSPFNYSPIPVADITDDADGFDHLGGAWNVAITEKYGRTYAVVTARDDGVQIIDITDPAIPTPVTGLTDGTDGFTELDGTYGVAITKISVRTYAVVASLTDDGVQIIDITYPAISVPVAAIADGTDGFTELDGAGNVAIAEISGRTYVVVASYEDDGVQIIDITDPVAPAPISDITDNTDGFSHLNRPEDVAIAEISGKTYAVTVSWPADSVQIINITNPATPVPVAELIDDTGGFTELDGAIGVEIAVISNRTYAVVASWHDDGVQIIDITNPAVPAPVSQITDGANGFTELNGPRNVAISEISGRTYAVIASPLDDGVQVIDLTNPASPVPVAWATDGVGGFTELDRAWDVSIAAISGRTYAVVASVADNGVQIIDITPPIR